MLRLSENNERPVRASRQRDEGRIQQRDSEKAEQSILEECRTRLSQQPLPWENSQRPRKHRDHSCMYTHPDQIPREYSMALPSDREEMMRPLASPLVLSDSYDDEPSDFFSGVKMALATASTAVALRFGWRSF